MGIWRGHDGHLSYCLQRRHGLSTANLKKSIVIPVGAETSYEVAGLTTDQIYSFRVFRLKCQWQEIDGRHDTGNTRVSSVLRTVRGV